MRDAILNGDLEQVKNLVNQGYDFNKDDNLELELTVMFNQLEILRFFDEIGLDLRFEGDYLLLISFDNDTIDISKFLISRLDPKTCKRSTFLDCLVMDGSLEHFKAMVEAGFDPREDYDHYLTIATENNKQEFVDYLTYLGCKSRLTLAKEQGLLIELPTGQNLNCAEKCCEEKSTGNFVRPKDCDHIIHEECISQYLNYRFPENSDCCIICNDYW